MVCGQEVRVELGGPSIKGQRAFGIFNLRRQGVPKHTWAQGEDRPLALLHPVLHSCPSQPPEPSGFLVLLVPPWFSWCPPGGGSCKLKSSSFSLTATPPPHTSPPTRRTGGGRSRVPSLPSSDTQPNKAEPVCSLGKSPWLPAPDAASSWYFLCLPQSSQQHGARSRWGLGRHWQKSGWNPQLRSFH